MAVFNMLNRWDRWKDGKLRCGFIIIAFAQLKVVTIRILFSVHGFNLPPTVLHYQAKIYSQCLIFLGGVMLSVCQKIDTSTP